MKIENFKFLEHAIFSKKKDGGENWLHWRFCVILSIDMFLSIYLSIYLYFVLCVPVYVILPKSFKIDILLEVFNEWMNLEVYI